MRRIALVLAFTGPVLVQAQKNLCAVMDSVVRTMERISYYTIDVDRKALNDSLTTICSDADSLRDLGPAFTHVLNALGDHHGRVMLDGQPIAWLTDITRSHRKEERAPDMEFWGKVAHGTFGFEASMRGEGIGYLRIPAVSGGDLNAVARTMRSGLDSLTDLGAQKWIIDLRVNSGGNMWPMLEALAPLFPEGELAGSLDRQWERFSTYAFRDGHFERNQYHMVELPRGKDRSQDTVVVLFGRYTASSGEVMAACFDQRPKTTSMGEATAGYTTENGWTVLFDRITLVMSESMLCTKEGKAYHPNVTPDFVVPALAPSFNADDAAINAALSHIQLGR